MAYDKFRHLRIVLIGTLNVTGSVKILNSVKVKHLLKRLLQFTLSTYRKLDLYLYT